MTNGIRYYYVLTQVNGCETESAASSQVTATPNTPAAPTPPTNLKASGASGKVSLKWTQSTSAGITGNKVYRWNGSAFVLIATLNRPTTSYTDANLQRRRTYTYYVTAVSGGGESQPSNQASATTK